MTTATICVPTTATINVRNHDSENRDRESGAGSGAK